MGVCRARQMAYDGKYPEPSNYRSPKNGVAGGKSTTSSCQLLTEGLVSDL